MSTEHRRSLYAFTLVAFLCAGIVFSGLRSDALRGVLHAVGVEPVLQTATPAPAEKKRARANRGGPSEHLVAQAPAPAPFRAELVAASDDAADVVPVKQDREPRAKAPAAPKKTPVQSKNQQPKGQQQAVAPRVEQRRVVETQPVVDRAPGREERSGKGSEKRPEKRPEKVVNAQRPPVVSTKAPRERSRERGQRGLGLQGWVQRERTSVTHRANERGRSDVRRGNGHQPRQQQDSRSWNSYAVSDGQRDRARGSQKHGKQYGKQAGKHGNSRRR